MWKVLEETWGGCGVEVEDQVLRTGLGAPFPRGLALDMVRCCDWVFWDWHREEVE